MASLKQYTITDKEVNKILDICNDLGVGFLVEREDVDIAKFEWVLQF